jgi:hypothetical protein
MDWTQENAIEFIELCKRKLIWDPKHPMYFNTIRNNLHGKNWEKE